MTTLAELNQLVAATRILANPSSGYNPKLAVGIADIFKAYIDLDMPTQLEAPIMGLANAILTPLEVEV